MYILSTALTAIFDIILRPFSSLSPIWGLLAISFVSGILMVIIFKHTSNQKAIRAAKDKIGAYLLEIRLFKDDVGLMLNAQKRILRTNLTYLRYSVIPMLIMLAPVVLILAQLGIRYENRPLKPGESVLVKMKFADPIEGLSVAVEPTDGLRLETPLLHIPDEREVDVRVKAITEGTHQLTISYGGQQTSMPIVVSNQLEKTYGERKKADFSGFLFSPGQKPLPKDSSLESINIILPERELSLFGLNMHWLLIFFIVSVVAGYSLKGVFKVEV